MGKGGARSDNMRYYSRKSGKSLMETENLIKMNSLMTEIWKCANIALNKGEWIKIHMHPNTINELKAKHDKIIANKDGYALTLFGLPIIEDEDIVEDNFWVERIISH